MSSVRSIGKLVPPQSPETHRALVSDQVFQTLLEAILTDHYAAGEKLPPQRVLATNLGVTMTSLREALKRLEQMGLLDVRHGDATRVRDWREHGAVDLATHLLFRSGGVDTAILGDAFEARQIILRDIAELAAHRRDADQVTRLRELAANFSAAPDAVTAQQIDFSFFAELAQAASNLVFVLILNSVRAIYFENSEMLPLSIRHHELAEYYDQIVDGVADKNPEKAMSAVVELTNRQRERAESILTEWGFLARS